MLEAVLSQIWPDNYSVLKCSHCTTNFTVTLVNTIVSPDYATAGYLDRTISMDHMRNVAGFRIVHVTGASFKFYLNIICNETSRRQKKIFFGTNYWSLVKSFASNLPNLHTNSELKQFAHFENTRPVPRAPLRFWKISPLVSSFKDNFCWNKKNNHFNGTNINNCLHNYSSHPNQIQVILLTLSFSLRNTLV